MAVVAALFYFGGRRSETLSGLGGPAATSAGSASTCTPPRSPAIVLIIAIIVAWLVEVAQGNDGSPYTQLGALGGLSYVLAVAFLAGAPRG